MSAGIRKIRILAADDHPIVCQGIAFNISGSTSQT